MKGGKLPLGYTIIEVMIVLAVSGVMFVIAASFINGKQAATAFTQGVHDYAAQIQTTMQDVQDGHYSDINFGCSAGPLPAVPTFTVAGAQGTNQACTFVGKFIHTPISSDTKQYEVFSLAANRLDTSYFTVVPIVQPGIVDLTVTKFVPQHLDVKSITNDAGTAVYGFGFVQGQGVANTGSGGGGYNTGTQSLNMVYAPSLSAATMDHSAAKNALTSTGGASKLVATNSISLCMTDGARYAQINIGGTANNNNQLLTDIKVVTTC